MKDCKVIYNFDPTFLVTTPTENGRYDKPLTKEFVVSHVNEVADHGVDSFFLCPGMLRRKLWDSKMDPHWVNEAPNITPPPAPWNWEWDDKAYFRMRDYIFSGGKPVEEIFKAVKERGLNFFFTYRMNDCHYLEKSTSFIHDTYWKEHPELRIGEYGGVHPNMHSQLVNLLQDYMKEEVRQHYLDILTELVSSFDVDGIELDFMRKPCLVPYKMIEEARPVITAFICQIRSMLDSYGKQRNKRIMLSVRVPHSLNACYELAMDIKSWDQLGYIDMLNASTSFLTNIFALDIESFTSVLCNAKVYGEMHYSLAYGKRWPNYGRKFIRNTTKEQYETGSYYLKKRGAYGVSLFNFVGSRQHEFNDPRGMTYPGAEPPFDALDHLADEKYLETCDKHYVVNRFIVDSREYSECAVPANDDLSLDIQLFETNLEAEYKKALMRVETETSSRHIPIVATINGEVLAEYVGTGELFTPVSIEGLPVLENVRYFKVPLKTLTNGINHIEVHNNMKTHPKEFITFSCLELAFYSRGKKTC